MGNTKKISSFQLTVLITIVIMVILAAIVFFSNKSSETANVITFEKQPSVEGQPILGREDAPVTVVEFGDFKCPACKAWGETVFPQLVDDYVDTGKVKFSYVNVMFHGQESQVGSLAAETVFKQNQDAYWEFHKSLFKEQPAENHDTPWLTREKVVEVASKIQSIHMDQFMSEFLELVQLEEINKDAKLVEEYKVSLTPTIMVNNIMLEDPFDYEKMKQLIEKELEEE